MIRGTDGYQYEDLSARFLQQPAPTEFNKQLRAHRKNWSQEAVEAFVEEYDCLVRTHGEFPAIKCAIDAGHAAERRRYARSCQPSARSASGRPG